MTPEEITKEMAEFYPRAVARLPAVLTRMPFEVKIDSQSTPLSPAPVSSPPEQTEEEQNTTLAPPPPGLTSVSPNVVSSAGGTTIIITGENFFSGVTVKIAGLDATNVIFISSTQIQCVTPADGIGFVNVEVTNPSGQKASSSSLLQYTNWPDNVLIQGTQTQRSGTYSGWPYPYTITIRLGSVPFTPPPGIVVYVSIVTGLVGVFGQPYPTLGYANLDSIAVDVASNPGASFIPTFTNASGPSIDCRIQVNATPNSPALSGFAEIAGAMHNGSSVGFPPVSPTYGDSSNQPRAFRINFNPEAALPPTVPSDDKFSWERGPSETHLNPFAWVSSPAPDPPGSSRLVRIRRLQSDGSLRSDYNGTATLSWVRTGGLEGTLGINLPATISFTSGVSNEFLISGNYTFNNAQNSQAHGYATLFATDGAVVGSVNVAVLNHL